MAEQQSLYSAMERVINLNPSMTLEEIQEKIEFMFKSIKSNQIPTYHPIEVDFDNTSDTADFSSDNTSVDFVNRQDTILKDESTNSYVD